MEPLVFTDLTPIEVPVTLGTKQYLLKEASESAAAKYKNAALKGTRVTETADGTKQATVDGVSDTEALLVSMCLVEVKSDSTFAPVSVDFIKGLPHRISNALFLKAEEISGLKRKETKEEIRKQIKTLQDKLAKLMREGTEDESLKNS